MSEAARVILITGFMGAGKTTIAVALARRLRCDMIDLDRFIFEREGRTPQVIIDDDGEQHFRQLETRALEEALKRAATETRASQPPSREAKERQDFFIIALGGGAWAIEHNRALIALHGGFTVWLDAPFDLCWRRIACEDGAFKRPLARERERARSLYDRRRAFYALASLRVEAGEEPSVETLAGEIAQVVSS